MSGDAKTSEQAANNVKKTISDKNNENTRADTVIKVKKTIPRKK